MATSIRLNELMRAQSRDSDLVFCNLPLPSLFRNDNHGDEGCADYLEYLDELTKDLKRVVLVKGSGMEGKNAFI